MNLALAVAMNSEWETAIQTIRHIGWQYDCLRVIQADGSLYEKLEHLLQRHPDAQYEILPALPIRPSQEQTDDIIYQAICRTHLQAFQRISEAIQMGSPIDYIVAIGDETDFRCLYEIPEVIEKMIHAEAKIGVSSVIRSRKHRPQEMDLWADSFIPEFYIAHAAMVEHLAGIAQGILSYALGHQRTSD